MEKLNSSLLKFLSNREQWSDFREIQKKSIPSILDGNDTLIIAPTASGKTEAALIPIFSEILNKKLDPVSVLYVAPLKALINDMHARIEKWGNYFGITAMKWHGDVSKSKKDKFLKNPTDFLEITPESLEVILMNKQSVLKNKIFKNIKYVVIDEIHYFADSDRGVQLNSILNRISKYLNDDVTTIGLSATVGNPKLVANWMNYENPANIVVDSYDRKFNYKILDIPEEKILPILERYKDKKILIFANSKNQVEKIHYILENHLDVSNVYIHHGSLNKEIREENEIMFKKNKNGFMVSTSTLELGIDIGNIDIVIQIGPTNSVSSFSQRIGRSGRKSNIQKTILVSTDVGILLSLAEVMLHKEKKSEEIFISKESKDIFFHQLLSIIFENGSIHVKDLFDEINGGYAFSDISYDECKFLLNDMKNKEFIDINNNYITLGHEFEKEFGKQNFMNFYAVFLAKIEYSVREGNSEIGTLDVSYAYSLGVGDEFVLAGQLWEVKSVDHDKYQAQVFKKNIPKDKIPRWFDSGVPYSYLLSRKVYDILLGKFDKNYLKPLDDGAKDVVENAIRKANLFGFDDGIIPVSLKSNELYIFTFAGNKANELLANLFKLYYDVLFYDSDFSHCNLKFKEEIDKTDVEGIIYNVKEILNSSETQEFIDDITQKFLKNKFINYLPEKNRGKLKMDLLFDKEGLLNVTENNMIYFMDNETDASKLFKID